MKPFEQLDNECTRLKMTLNQLHNSMVAWEFPRDLDVQASRVLSHNAMGGF